MGKDYKVLPRFKSYDNIENEELQAVHVEGAGSLNSDVVVLDGRVEEFRIPNRGVTEKRFGAKLPPVEMRSFEEGEEKIITLGEEDLPDIRSGVHPIKQLIFYETHGRGLSEDEILDLLFDDVEWLDRGEGFKEPVLDIIDDMMDENSITRLKSGKYRSDLAEIDEIYDLGEEGHDLEAGIYPVVRLIWDTAFKNNGMKEGILVRKVDEWNWTKDRSATKFWINWMEKNDMLEEIEDGFYGVSKRP